MSQKWQSSKFQEYPNASQNIQAEKLNEKHIEPFNLYEEIRPPTVGQEFKESFKEENAGNSATPPSLMVSGKPFPPKVASWDSKHLSHTPTMQPTNVTGVRGGPPPALPPKPKPRNTSMGFPSGRVAPISDPVPLVSGSSTKPNVLLPPKSDQVLAQSVRLMNSPAHSSASRTNSNNSGASGSAASALSNKTSSDNCAQSQKSSSSEIVQHHTTRVGTSDSSKSPETMSEPTGNTTLDSTLKAESLTKLTTDSENVHENPKDNSDSNRNSPAPLPPIVSDPQVVTGRKVGDIANEKFILSQSTHGSIKSINSFDDKKLESPLRNSESERGRGFEPEGSIDLSPTTYSETSAHTTQSSSIQSSPPSYFLWQESLQSLIDDAEGIELFEEFLKEMDLLYLLKFLKTVAGMKKEILSGYGTTENRSDPSTWELEILELREQKFKFYQKSLSAVNKAFINTNVKNRYQQLPEELGGKPLLDAQTKSTINSKIEAIKQTLSECTTSCIPGSSPTCRYHVPIDGNIFDGVQNNVYECLEQKPYYKFFESQIYIDHVNDVNEQRNLQLESEDNASQNRPMIVSGGEQSSGSSISKNMQSGNTTLTVDTTQIDSVPLTSITSATSDKTKDSGFSATSLVGGSSSDKSFSSVSKHGPIAQSGLQPSISNSESVLEQSSHQSKSSSDLLSISQTSTLGSSQLSTSVIHQNTIVGEPLPAIEEDRELKFSKHNAPSTFLPNTDFSDSSSNSKLKQRGSDSHQRSEAPYINKDNELPHLSSSFNSSRSYSTHGKRANNPYFQESYPSTSVPESIGVDSSRSQGFRGGNYRGQSKPSLTKPSYAYHTNEAFASSYYPVSKQNSEVQSQSSGALGGGDTTDDNYSTFTDPSPYQPTDPRTGRVSKSSSDIHRMPGNLGQKFTPYNKNPQIAAIGGGRSSEPTHAGNRHASRHDYKSLKYEERRNEKTKKKIAEDHINRGNREQPQTITTKPPNKAPAPNGTLAESKPAEFADLLIGKLNAVLKMQEKEEESSKKLDHKLKTMEAESSVASFPPAAFVNQRLLLNRSRSAANDPNEESDQSILDDHVARNFPNTPPVPRSPPNASSMRSRSSKASGAGRSSRSTGSGQTTKTLHHQSFDSRMGPHASFSHQTLPSRSNVTGSNQTASAFGSSRGAMHQSFGGPSQSGNVSGYGGTLPEQDLVYYPDSRAHQASRNRPRHPGSAPFSDTGFPISSNNPINAFSARQPNQSQPISYGSEERTKHIENWVQNSAQIAAQPGASRRAKSQTREGQSEGSFSIDPMSTHGGRYGPGHHPSFQSHPHHAGSQIGSVQPHELTTRLQQVHRMGNQGFGNTSLMAPSHHSGNVNMNMSLPVSGSRDDSMQGFRQAASGQNNFIVALYSFPQEKEDTPYRIKIPFFGPTNTVTLHMVKDHMPKKGNNYRFYFKCKIDGDVCFEEVTDNNAHVPTNDGKIVVQCRA